MDFCTDSIGVKVFDQDKYPTIFLKAAALLYCIAGSAHPFVDGNKRTALLTTKYFLNINGYDFSNYTIEEMKDFMLSIANSQLNDGDIKQIAKWIKQHCVMKNNNI